MLHAEEVSTGWLAEHAWTLAAEIAESYEQGGEPPSDSILGLCTLAASQDLETSQAGARALFKGVVEPWADRFDPRLCDAYADLFSRVIDFCRRLPGGVLLDRKLRALGIRDLAGLQRRARRVRRTQRWDGDPHRVWRAVVLSRVTLGADVAVTSVVLAGLKQRFPEAEIVFPCGPKTAVLYSPDERLRCIPVPYRRDATLMGRLLAWAPLADLVAEWTDTLPGQEHVIIDPDSRLTQLGLLPLIPEDRSYHLFESRSFSANGAEGLGELTACWLEETLGAPAAASRPYVPVAEEDRELGRMVRETAPGRLAAVNLGVGGNPAKRLPGPFELQLVRLLLEAGYTVALDRGAGQEELERTGRILEALSAEGKRVGELSRRGCRPGEVIPWKGSLAGFGGVIGAADLYVGYDSAGSHLAAALGVEVIDIFAGAPCERMRRRWRPSGAAPVHVIAVEETTDPEAVLDQIRERLL